MYLKLKGVDPKTHPVISELVSPPPKLLFTNHAHFNLSQDRIREYYDKISRTENPPARPTAIDKAAAGRFIKHAINSVKWTKTAAETAQEGEDTPEATSPNIPVRVTEKMRERDAYTQKLREQAAAGQESEEEDLQVFDDAMQVDGASEPTKSAVLGQRKRQRPVVDPFAGAFIASAKFRQPADLLIGYGDKEAEAQSSESNSEEAPSMPQSSSAKKPKTILTSETSKTATGAKRKKGKKKTSE